MPDHPVPLRQADPGLFPVVIKQAQLDLLGDLGKMEKLLPPPSNEAPNGYGKPGHMHIQPPGSLNGPLRARR
jgi:hypothetical protein